MKPAHLTAVAAAIAAGIFIYSKTSSADALDYVSWDRALETARSERKPILLYFGGSW